MTQKTKDQPKSPKERMRDYRARMRASGLRPVQIWVPDTRSPDFLKEAKRQSRLAAQGKDEQDVMDFLESLEDWDEA